MTEIYEIIANLKEAKQKLENSENVTKLEKELGAIAEQLKNISKFGNYRSFEVKEKRDDLLLVSVPGEKQKKRVNVGTLNNLTRQLNIIFAHFECPFKDDLSEIQKRELIAGILKIKPEEVLIEKNLDDANRAKDENWEKNDPQANKEKGITEPTEHSYEWFKRWWKFHQQFPKVEFAYGTSKEDFSEIGENGKEKFLVLQEFPITEGKDNISWAKYKDPVKLIKEKKMYEEEWVKKHLFNSETKKKHLLIQSYLDTVPRQEMSVSPYKDFYAADFIHYFHTVFNRDSSLYQNLNPKEIRDDYKYDVLHMVTWQPKLGKEDSLKYEDNETKGIKGAKNSLDGWNYLELGEPEYIHRFTNIEPGIKGLIEVVEKVFYENYKDNKNILDEVIKQSGGKTLTKVSLTADESTEENKSWSNIYEENLGKIFTSYEEINKWLKEFKELPQETKEKCWNCLLNHFSEGKNEADLVSKIEKVLEEEINRLEEVAKSQTEAKIKVEPSKCRII